MSIIDLNQYGVDALGDVYEYLIGEFAAGSGKKVGEFYTPSVVSELITCIVTKGKEGKPAFSIYDKIIAELIQSSEKIPQTLENQGFWLEIGMGK